jgi:hypothetical protein
MKYAWTLTDIDTESTEVFSFDAVTNIASETVKGSWEFLFPSKPCPDVKAWVLRSKEFEKLYVKTSKGIFYRKWDFSGEKEYGRRLKISEIVGFHMPLNPFNIWGVFIREGPAKQMAIVLLHELEHIEKWDRKTKETMERKRE